MSDIVNALARLPDLAILALSATAFGLMGGAIALLSNWLWFERWPKHSSYEDKLADTAHTSLLGFSAFVLALLITNGFLSLFNTEADVRREAVEIYRLGQELDALGPTARDAKQSLAAYAKNVSEDEWARLASLPSSLSPLAQRNLDDLWRSVRVVQRGLDRGDPVRDDLAAHAAEIETLRSGRLAEATTTIPSIFWVIVLLFVAAASFLSGREAPKRFGMQVNLIHMAAIGLAVGLVIILNNPFRGQTSVSATIIRDALAPSAPSGAS